MRTPGWSPGRVSAEQKGPHCGPSGWLGEHVLGLRSQCQNVTRHVLGAPAAEGAGLEGCLDSRAALVDLSVGQGWPWILCRAPSPKFWGAIRDFADGNPGANWPLILTHYFRFGRH